MAFYEPSKRICNYSGEDNVDGALEKRSLENYNKFIEEYDIVKESSVVDFRLLTKFTQRKQCKKYISNPPYNDHELIYETRDGSRLYTYQPYKHDLFNIISLDEMRNNIIEWGADKGISLIGFSEDLSFHYPGKTVMVVLKVTNENEFIKKIYDFIPKYKIYNADILSVILNYIDNLEVIDITSVRRNLSERIDSGKGTLYTEKELATYIYSVCDKNIKRCVSKWIAQRIFVMKEKFYRSKEEI